MALQSFAPWSPAIPLHHQHTGTTNILSSSTNTNSGAGAAARQQREYDWIPFSPGSTVVGGMTAGREAGETVFWRDEWNEPKGGGRVGLGASAGGRGVNTSMGRDAQKTIGQGFGGQSAAGALAWRNPLGGINTVNINPQHQVTPQALASPFIPNIDRSVWAPPALPVQPQQQRPRRPTVYEVEEELVHANEQIHQLTLDNDRLRGVLIRSANRAVYTPLSGRTTPARPDSIISNFPDGSSGLAPGSMLARSATFNGNLSELNRSLGFGGSSLGDSIGTSLNEQGEKGTGYSAPQYIIQSVLQGSFSYANMPVELIRPIVWIVAHHQPRSTIESSGLKTAVNALTTRLKLIGASDHANAVIKAITEWAKPLCFTSCGNYLCQQLLERGTVEDRAAFLAEIIDDIVPIANNKFGTHVLCKAINVKDLEEPISAALFGYGVFESMKTGARRLWREYLEKCRQCKSFGVFRKVNDAMEGRWADLACVNEHGSIAVQQVFEVYGSPELMAPCFEELLENISYIANNQFGHFVLTKLVGHPNLYPHLFHQTCDAIITAYPPVAVTHHGVNFAKIALTEGGHAGFVRYVEAICSDEDGRTPGIVTIATSSIGKAHLTFVISCLSPTENLKVRQTCRAYCTTLRNSQSGNDLLRSLGLLHAVGIKNRTSIV
ncbi:hypothetical protein IAT38_006481 [Cryptococcus sp. DSM 104549]